MWEANDNGINRSTRMQVTQASPNLCFTLVTVQQSKYLSLYVWYKRNGQENENEKEQKSGGRPHLDPAKGKPKADLFFVAYVLNGTTDIATRPVTFAFNGGPGSSSVWLHVGGVGPRRVLLSDRGEALPPPATLTKLNPKTFILSSKSA